jgi:hypothetical protein
VILMLKKVLLIILAISVIGMNLLLGGCGSTKPGVTKDVYLGGLDISTHQPCYWKNEVFHSLPIPGFYTGYIMSSYVTGSDVYFAGFLQTLAQPGSLKKACLWINGALTVLNGLATNEDSFAYSVLVSDGNIHVAGYCQNSSDMNIPCIWQDLTTKNPTPLSIPTDAMGGNAKSVQVSDGQVYVAGYIQNYDTRHTPCIWQIGAGRTDFIGYNSTEDSTATCLYIYDGDRYIGGTSGNDSGVMMPGYWKNEVWQTPTLPIIDDSLGGAISGIFVDANNVYAVGLCSGMFPCYWINGTLTSLDIGSYGMGVANGIYVSDGNVYISGGTFNLGMIGQPCYWKNGVRRGLPVPDNDTAVAYTIFVAQST